MKDTEEQQLDNLVNEARIIVAQLALGGTVLDMYPIPIQHKHWCVRWT
jgi:hypothetical protein